MMTTRPATIVQLISRELAARYGEEAVQIMENGAYRAASGKMVGIADLLQRSVKGTTSYPPDIALPQEWVGIHQTGIEVVNETTLAAVQRLRASEGPGGKLQGGLSPGRLRDSRSVAGEEIHWPVPGHL